jgi:acetyl-CoA C-acetyltransferase
VIDPRTPVLVGAGQFVHRGDAESCPVPIELCAIAVREAAHDAGLSVDDLSGADCVATVRFTVDEPVVRAMLPVPSAANPPGALAGALGIAPTHLIETATGGNMPQALLNAVCERIARGDMSFAVLAGAEFLGSLNRLVKAGRMDLIARHAIEGDATQERLGSDRPGCSQLEHDYGLSFPANTYPLFENALRAHLGLDLDAHRAMMGRLMAPFTEVAASNPHAWFQQARSADELVTVSQDNRMVGFPYPKYLNAILQVNQSAALLVMSHAKAVELGVAPDRMVFLHGCGDVNDLWNPIDRVDFHSSPALAVAGREALAMASCTIGDIAAFDLYSCFPVAVELACRELGIDPDGGKALTLTGGLPYFGGPGNNYAMHSIAEAVRYCREHRASRVMVTANGWFLTKQAVGIYSSEPVSGPWVRRDPALAQSTIDALSGPSVIETAEPGVATIETYTVVHGRDGPRMGIVVGRDTQGRRFLAQTPKGDAAIMADLEARESVGRTGRVSHVGGRNIFTPD